MGINLRISELLHFLIEKDIGYVKIDNMNKLDEDIVGFSSIYDTKPYTLSWMTTQSLDWLTIRASVIISSMNAELPDHTNIVFIRVVNPRNTFALIMREYCPPHTHTGIAPTAIIGNNCDIERDVYIGNYVVLGNNVKIGRQTRIHSHVIINDDVTIGCNCVIHSGVVIGTDGFGYEQDYDGTSFKIPHIGSVVIEDHVEVGSNCCIARGVLSNTTIGKNTKIGNLSHISHNVRIGANTMITHLAHIGGSLTVEDSCWIAPGAIYKQGLTIGRNSTTGLGAVVIRDVNPFDTVAGVPAKAIKKVLSDA